MDHISKKGFSNKQSPNNVTNVTRTNENVSNDNKDNKYVNNVNPKKLTREELLSLLEEQFTCEKERQEWLAETLASELSDSNNLNYYRKIAKQYPGALLLESLSITKDAVRNRIVRTTSAKFFVGVVKRKALREIKKMN